MNFDTFAYVEFIVNNDNVFSAVYCIIALRTAVIYFYPFINLFPSCHKISTSGKML